MNIDYEIGQKLWTSTISKDGIISENSIIVYEIRFENDSDIFVREKSNSLWIKASELSKTRNEAIIKLIKVFLLCLEKTIMPEHE